MSLSEFFRKALVFYLTHTSMILTYDTDKASGFHVSISYLLYSRNDQVVETSSLFAFFLFQLINFHL